ncbi:MAG: hypothetical protein RL577_1117 [Bacteroidota bacterium]
MIDAVDIVGYGRLGQALHRLFINKGIKVRCIYSHSQTGEGFAARDSWLSDVDLAPLVFLAIPDDQINPQLSQRSASSSLFIQCSGNSERFVSNSFSTAVWYPLQSFSLGRTPDWNALPILIESPSPDLVKWSQDLGLNVRPIDGKQRRALHLAAVWANNFGQTVIGMAAEICRSHEVDPDLLKPLLDETLSKALALPAKEAQTGPARRGDQKTLQDHIELMKEDHSVQELYQNLSQFIIERYGKV